MNYSQTSMTSQASMTSQSSMTRDVSQASLVTITGQRFEGPSEQANIVKLVERHDEEVNQNRADFFKQTKPMMLPPDILESFQKVFLEWQALRPGLIDTEKHINAPSHHSSKPDYDDLLKWYTRCVEEIDNVEKWDLSNQHENIRSFRLWINEQFSRLKSRIVRLGYKLVVLMLSEKGGGGAPDWAVQKVREWVKQHDKGMGITSFDEITTQYNLLNRPSTDQNPNLSMLTLAPTSRSPLAIKPNTGQPASSPEHTSGVYANPNPSGREAGNTRKASNAQSPAWQAGTQNFTPTTAATATSNMSASKRQFPTGPSMGHPPGPPHPPGAH